MELSGNVVRFNTIVEWVMLMEYGKVRFPPMAESSGNMIWLDPMVDVAIRECGKVVYMYSRLADQHFVNIYLPLKQVSIRNT